MGGRAETRCHCCTAELQTTYQNPSNPQALGCLAAVAVITATPSGVLLLACFEKCSKTEHKECSAILEKNGGYLTHLDGNKHGITKRGEYMQIHNIFLLASHQDIHCLYSQIQLLTTMGNFTNNKQSLHRVSWLRHCSDRGWLGHGWDGADLSSLQRAAPEHPGAGAPQPPRLGCEVCFSLHLCT